jgi:predicted phosphodiesterase
VRFLILSDVHANNEALRAVLCHVRRKRYDQVLFLGDAVGYGASPNQALRWLRSLGTNVVIVRGNHDRVCSGLDSGEYFNQYAREATVWTREHLDPRNLEYLRAFPVGPIEINDELAVCHGSPMDEDTYIFSAYDAQIAFNVLSQQVIFFGHTHVPSSFSLIQNGSTVTLDVQLLSGRRTVLDIEPTTRYLINPGSVGQPRDRDPRASYAIYDDQHKRLHLYRVTYRTESARRRIHDAGLPNVLGDRLLYGA